MSVFTLAISYLTTSNILWPWCWEGLGAGGEGDDRGWDGWMASLTRWAWVWVDSGSLWWTGRPGVLQFMGPQRVGHDWATELNWTEYPAIMNLTFQVPMQYCSLRHQTLLPSPVTSTTGHDFHFCSISSFFLELFLYSSLVAYWALTDLGSSSFSVISFSLFILFMGFSKQEYRIGLPILKWSLFQWTMFC